MAGSGGLIGEITIGGGTIGGGSIGGGGLGGGDLPYITMDRCERIVTCPAGQYLPANTLVCQTCLANNWCPGGTFSQSTSIQGMTACDAGLVSAPGSSSIGACVTPY